MVINGGSRVEGTREAILSILRRRDGVSVDALARELELAGATVRRHLDVLLRDDLVSVTQVRGRTGRPRYAFSLTETGAEVFPHHYVRLTHRLLSEIVKLDVDETAGQDGTAIAGLLFTKMAQRLADDYASRVEGETLEARVRSAVRLLADEGIDYEVEASDGGVQLLGRGCPCGRFATGGAEFGCDHDRQLLEVMIGATVETLPDDQLPNDFLRGYRVIDDGNQGFSAC